MRTSCADRASQPEDATEEQKAAALEEAKAITRAEHVAVVEAGGLVILGTERHESRRIDNQLRGRAGRQGDPGKSQFYLSLEDDLMRLFGGDRMDRISSMMQTTDIPDDMPIQAGLVSKAIQSAQRQVETMNFAARKYVLEYDDVMNKQRSVIYGERNAILDGKDIHGRVEEMMAEAISNGVLEFAPERVYSEEWDWDGLSLWYRELTGIDGAVEEMRGEVDNPHEAADALTGRAMEAYASKEEDLGVDGLRELERQVMLRVIDTRWMDHLQEMDYLKDGIGLRAMGQRDPLVEYKSEAFDMFGGLVRGHQRGLPAHAAPHPGRVRARAADARRRSRRPTTRRPASLRSSPERRRLPTQFGVGGPSPDQIAAASAAAGGSGKAATVVKDKEDPWSDVGRNDPCPCGSGKKYKRCHGASA